jgi:nicotinate-nucleotide adenylyltransferase
MLRAAVEGDDRIAVDDLELRRGGVSYTVETLREIKARDPQSELTFLMGADQFRDFGAWREPREVARLARLAVMTRDGETPDTGGAYGIVNVAVTRIDISATEIRARVAAGRSIRYYVPEAVREIIERERLYH